jgi:hypothetical protein
MNPNFIPISALVLNMLFGMPVRTQGQSTSIKTSAAYTFGDAIQLNAEIENGLSIIRAAVFMRSSAADSTRVELATIDAENPLLARVTINPGEINLGAFETLSYWWQIDLESGATLRTEELQLHYSDDRFTWESLNSDPLKVFWHDRGLAQGQTILEIGRKAIELSAQRYALYPTSSITIVVYNNLQELEAAIELAGPTWAGGKARPETGIMLVQAGSSPEGIFDLERVIPHETVHLLLEQRSGEGVSWMPAWLAEGMATLAEDPPSSAQHLALEQQIKEGGLIPITELCASFPLSEDQAVLAYAESASFVGYLLDIYGKGGLSILLDAYREGASCEGGVQRVYQRQLAQLEEEWHHSIGLQARFFDWRWLIVLGAVVLSAILFGARSIRDARRPSQGPERRLDD